MDLEGIVLREINQSEKDKTVRLHSHVEYKTKQETNKTKQEQTHRYGQQEGGG